MSSDFEAVVIGAGVVGLAIGRELAQKFRSVAIVERHAQFGFETSSRNSEVMHAGIYYAAGSLKANLCREGLVALSKYCVERRVPHRKCGKLIVAKGANGEAGLERVRKLAEDNNVRCLQMVSALKAKALEPEVACDHALLSPDTGIVDSHSLMAAYEADFSDAGGCMAYRNNVVRVECSKQTFSLWFEGEDSKVKTSRLVNAAGLHSAKVASLVESLRSSHIPQMRYARGVYFALQGTEQPFSRLVYPLPDAASLGIHATIDLKGYVRFGPDVEWIAEADDYHVDPEREGAFRESIRSYYPAIDRRTLQPAYAGIRPKLVGPGEAAADFKFDDSRVHGVNGLINLYGIESPGLTASLAIAKHVASLLD